MEENNYKKVVTENGSIKLLPLNQKSSAPSGYFKTIGGKLSYMDLAPTDALLINSGRQPIANFKDLCNDWLFMLNRENDTNLAFNFKIKPEIAKPEQPQPQPFMTEQPQPQAQTVVTDVSQPQKAGISFGELPEKPMVTKLPFGEIHSKSKETVKNDVLGLLKIIAEKLQ